LPFNEETGIGEQEIQLEFTGPVDDASQLVESE
jgi:hypothetical protein